MLGDGTCQLECLNTACSNDAGDCDASLCSTGCYPYMVGDGLCEEVCHVDACQWDGGDCDCSPGCTAALLANGQCDSLCSNENCDFDHGTCENKCSPRCSENMRGDGVCNPECLNSACERDNGDCECAPGCLYSDVGQRKPECQVPECNYDMVDAAGLFCAGSDPSIFDCSAVECYNEWGEEAAICDFACEQSSVAIEYKMSCCTGCCSEHYFPHPVSPNICVRAPDRTSEQRPRLIYVASDTSSESVDGAFPSLSAAFDSIFEKYVEVRLLSGTHALTASKHFIDFVYVRSYLETNEEPVQQVEALRRMKLTSQSCVASPGNCTRAVVASVSTNYPFFRFSGSRYLEVSNVDFTSKLKLQLCTVGGIVYCRRSIEIFRVLDGMFARFVNVTFSDYKNSVSSILSVKNATVVLESVDFLGIMLHGDLGERGVVSVEDADFNYTRGSVSLTNNLWDYKTLGRSGGALSAIGANLDVENVNFTNNFMGSADKNAKLASLVYIRDNWRVRFTNCDFAFNVGRRGAVISIYTFKWEVTSGDYEAARAVLNSAVEISNCRFQNNTGTVGSSIYVHFLTGQQSVLITNCTFLNEFAEVNSVIVGYSRLPSISEGKSREAVTLNGATRAVEYPVPRLTVSHFRNCNIGLFGLIALENIWSVRVEGITVEDVPAGDARNSSTNSLDVLTTIAGAHLPRSRPSSSLQQCQSLLNFTGTGALELASLTIARSNCSSAVVATGARVSVKSSHFGWTRGSALYGFVLYVQSQAVTMQQAVFEGNENDAPDCRGTVYLAASAVNIVDSRFASNAARQGAALFLTKAQSVEMRGCTFELNSADMGGAVFVEGSGLLTFHAASLVFRNNVAVSYGGALCVVASGQFTAKMTLEDSAFEQCRAKIGSAIYTSEGVVFLPGTQVATCEFTDNVSVLYGTCAFELVSGEIAFISTRFQRSIGLYTSAMHMSYSSAQSTHLLTLTDTLFDSNEATNVVSISSTASPLEVVGSSVVCSANAGTCFSLESANFTCSHCRFSLNSAVSGGALQLHSSAAACRDCDFRSNSAEFAGGAVLAKSYSLLACLRCRFLNNTSQWQGGALFMEQSTLVLDASTFAYNSARSGGSALFLVFSNQQSVVRLSRFASNKGTSYGCINLINAFMKFEECEFTENSSEDLIGGLVLSQSVVSIEGSQFANQTGALGVFVFAISSNVTVSSSLLSSATAANTGAGMSLISSQANIENCTFEALFSTFGGAVAAQDESNLTVSNCSFRHITSRTANRGVVLVSRSSLHLTLSSLSSYNQGGVTGLQARITVTGSAFANGTGTLGGGITCTRCPLAVVSSCSFERLAADRGSGIYLEGSREPDNFRISDSRFLHCEGTLSGAVYIEEFPGSLENCLFRGNAAGRGGAIHIAPSQLPSAIRIAGNAFTSNSAAHRGGAICWEATPPVLLDNEFSDNTANYGADVASYAVSMSMRRESLDSLVSVSGGKVLQPLVLDLLDAYGQTVTDDSESIAQLTSANNGTIVSGEVRVQARYGQLSFAGCSITAQPGTSTSLSITMLTGSRQDFSVSVRHCMKGEFLAQSLCVPCAPGTYSLTNHSSCANCPSNAVCFGNFTITPKPGHWRSSPDSDAFFECPNPEACLGSLTGACADGYEGVKCQACAHGHSQWGSVYCSKCWETAARTGLHVCVSFLLVCALGLLVGLVLYHDSRLLLYIKIFVNHAQTVMLFRSLGLPWPREALELFNAFEVFGAFPEYVVSANCVMESYYEKVVAMTLTIPVLVLFALLTWGSVALAKGLRQSLLGELVSTAVAICFVTHTSVMRAVLDPLRCEEVDSGEYWLPEHSFQCWTAEHRKYAFGLSVPSVVVYGFALPTAILVFLRRELLLRQTYSIHFRYATAGYPQKLWYWELVMLCWKMLVIACAVVLSHLSPLFPALSAFGFIILLIGLLRYRVHDSLETQSLYACFSTLYCGLVLSTGLLGAASKALFGVVLGLNVFFVGAFTWKVGVLLYQQVKKRKEQTSNSMTVVSR